MPLVSIIVPVYNVEQYLRQCLDSLINQTLQDIEIICVNDASPDNSGMILDEYVAKDKRIVILNHEKNQGLGPARNTGVACAKSPYIGFVDSDDYVSTTMFESLYKAITTNESQMAWCATTSITDDGIVKEKTIIPAGNYTVLEVLNNPLLYPGILPVWNKLFCTDLIKDIKQLPIVSEDQPLLAEYFLKCERITLINEPNYFYRNRQGTLSKPEGHTTKHWDAFFYAHNLFYEFLMKRYTIHDLRIQTVLRYFSVFWRIKNFTLLHSENWSAQEICIKNYVRRDSMYLKKNNRMMYFFLLMFLNSHIPLRLKRSLLNVGLNLSKRTWISKHPYRTLIKDVSKIIYNTVKSLSINFFDLVERNTILIISIGYKLVVRRKIWLIGERTDTAQENGWYFYKYMVESQPKERVYYIIDKKSKNAEILNEYTTVVQYNSFKHKILFDSCIYYVNSHYNSGFPRTVSGKKLYPKLKSIKNVFLQHGITYADVSPFYGKKNSSIDLFICGAKPEYDYVLRNFGYEPNEVALTGFARFDGLHDVKVKRQILFMPTWRRNLENLNRNEFVETEYFNNIQSILENNKLHELLSKNDFELVFFPHYQLLEFLSSFKTTNNRVVIPTPDFNVQQLLKNAVLLLTDVSSVHFDVAYMHKPIIYYCWDYESIVKNHLPKGYFNHKEMGFGEVLLTEELVVNKIEYYLNSCCELESEYVERIDNFFPLHDDKNCERIYDVIQNV